jgi:hypothetical protein
MNASSSTMYTNGIVTGTGAGSGAGLNNNASSVLFMGGDVRYDFRRMNGNIAALKVYNRALTSTEALQNFGALRGRFGI